MAKNTKTTNKAKTARKTATRKPAKRVIRDTRPQPGYPLPVMTAQRTYLIGDTYTRVHCYGRDKRQAMKYYRDYYLNAPSHLHVPANPTACVLLR